MAARIWFNKGFSSLYNVLSLIREGDVGQKMRLVCSHTNAEFVGFAAADESFVEPVLQEDEDYLDWCLEFCGSQKIDLFNPARRAALITKNASKFSAIGTQIYSVCPAEFLSVIDNKARFYEYCEQYDFPIPEYQAVTNAKQFDEAYSTLRNRHPLVCFKPTISVFGLGFRLVCEKGFEISRLLNGEVYQIGLEHSRLIFSEQESFRELMVMQYLEGKERSVDCLADNGKLIRYVIRRKSGSAGGIQLIEDNTDIGAITERLVSLFQLNGLFNVQFRDSNGIPYLLEINPRMSGGLHFTAFSGLNLPYWGMASALSLCRQEDIPKPLTGIKVGKADIGVLVT